MIAGKRLVLVLGIMVPAVAAASQASALGARETDVRSVSGFDRVILSTSGRLSITQGDEEGLQVSARAGDLANIVTEVRDGTLIIRWKSSEPAFAVRPPEYHLTMRTIAGLETHSSGSMEANGLHARSLQVRISSSGSISIESLDADTLDVRVSSSGSFEASGKVRQQNIVLSSSGDCRAGDLASEAASVRASSSGNATLRVSDRLEASVNSSGSVRYYGNPRVASNVTSSGTLVKLGE